MDIAGTFTEILMDADTVRCLVCIAISPAGVDTLKWEHLMIYRKLKRC